MNAYDPTTPSHPPGPSSKKAKPPFISLNPPSSPPDPTKVRTYAACRACRVKKIKCLPGPSTTVSLDSSAPPGPCQQCTQSRVDCTYPPSRDRAAYSRQYVQNLEARVQALEVVQNRLMPLLDAFERGTSNGSTEGHRILPAGPSRRAEENGDEVDDEVVTRGPVVRSSSQDLEDAGQITQDERGNYRWIGSSNTFSLLSSFAHPSPTNPSPPNRSSNHPTAPHDNPYFGPVAGSGVIKALPPVDEVKYPTPQAAAEMVDAYFAEVHPCLPVMAEHEFRAAFTALMQRRAKNQPQESDGFISVAFAVFALGERVIVTSRAWQRERTKLQNEVDPQGRDETVLPGEAEAGVIWYERAQILHYTTLKDVDIHQVQCLTLMAAFQASVNAMPMSWLLAGQALRVAQDLGLHRSTARLKLSFVEKQIRSRCWWAIYGLERLVSISLGRPLGVDDMDIDVSYPEELDDQGLLRIVGAKGGNPTPRDLNEISEPESSTMSGFVALTKLCRIAGRVTHVLYRPSNGRSVSDQSWAISQQNTINKLDKLLRDWLDNEVPTKYKKVSSIRPVQHFTSILSNSYLAILITLHRNFLPPTPDFPRPKPLPESQSLSHCVEAARSVIHMAATQRDLVPPSHHLAVMCQFLWTSAIILLLCEVHRRDPVVADAVGPQIDSCRRSLQALEPVWPGSRKLKELLNDAEKRTKEVVVAARPRSSSHKKRKPAGHIERPMGPPASTSPSHRRPNSSGTDWQGYQSLPDGTDQLKRARTDAPRYETSDTRTNLREDAHSFQAWDANSLPAQAAVGDLNPSLTDDGLDMTFDIGGVDFNGLEMLQGFTGADLTSFWNTLASDPFMPNTRQSPPIAISDRNTPRPGSGPGTGPGLSPSTWTFQNSPMGMGGSGSGSGVGVAGGEAEFWNQVAGESFDWAADPSMPFNI